MSTTRVCYRCGLAVPTTETGGVCSRCGTQLLAVGEMPTVPQHPASPGAPGTGQTPIPAIPSRPPIVSPAPNPFADVSPPNYQMPPYQMPYYPAWQPDRNRALAKVRGPAILLIISGVLVIVCGMVAAVAVPYIATQATNEEDRIIGSIFCGIGAVFALAGGPFIVWSAARMLVLKSYALAMTALIVAAVCALLTCWIAAFIFIWPLMVLLDSEVKACFDRPDAKSP